MKATWHCVLDHLGGPGVVLLFGVLPPFEIWYGLRFGHSGIAILFILPLIVYASCRAERRKTIQKKEGRDLLEKMLETGRITTDELERIKRALS